MYGSKTKYYNDNLLLTPLQHNIIIKLQNFGPLTRKELMSQLSIPRTTIYDNLLKLLERQMVEKFTRHNGKRGHPITFWKIKD